MYHFMRDVKWEDDSMLRRYQIEAAKLLSHQKAGHTVGAAHQYCGKLGKKANC
jgi:SRSO17 transposase